MKAVILAGGSGTRLWPRSRLSRPKQLLDIVAKNTMLQETINRIQPLISQRDIFVVTNSAYADIAAVQLPAVPRGNIIVEPEGHGTAPCIGLAALYIKRIDFDDVVAVLSADHLIAKAAAFRQALVAAEEVARQGYLVVLGMRPSSPQTGYGYIGRGDLLGSYNGHQVFKVAQFSEKPDRETAERYLRSGSYFWNGGIFIWRNDVILEEIAKHLPDLYRQLLELEPSLGTEKWEPTLKRIWKGVADETIDFGVMERTDRAAVIPVDVGWSDVGDWATLADLLPADRENNVVVGHHVGYDTTGCLVYGPPQRLIATIGLRDIIIVDAGDAILICPRERAQDVKTLVNKLKQEKKLKYL
ncbi:MAG: mannose-1-phosphate guanylyltransferase [Chloroflexi bacterium]|nr:mannose-1-phosphate guanylyltransferase [Chloroflexota bacterium]